jgi:uncharacterized protein
MNGWIGVISDTHGLLRPEALKALRGAALIIHAGDIGGRQIIDRLQTIAPVRAVRGNIDTGLWAKSLPSSDLVEFNRMRLYVIHDLKTLDLDPTAAGIQGVISGHSHRPSIREEKGIVLLNPGSAGPRRFKLPISLARIAVADGKLAARLIRLPVTG